MEEPDRRHNKYSENPPGPAATSPKYNTLGAGRGTLHVDDEWLSVKAATADERLSFANCSRFSLSAPEKSRPNAASMAAGSDKWKSAAEQRMATEVAQLQEEAPAGRGTRAA